MAFYHWRRFNFFDVAKDVDGGSLNQALNDSSAQMTCVTSGRGYILVGDDVGRVHCLNRRLAVQSFKAFESWVHAMCQVRQTSFLVCVGKDAADGCAETNGNTQSILKVFDLDKTSEEGEFQPLLVRTTKLCSGSFSATCVAVEETPTLVAVGFSDGSVTLLRGGELTRDRGTKRKVILGAWQSGGGIGGGGANSCSGLAFKTVAKATWLYVATTAQVMAFNVTVRDKETCSNLDSIGCEKNMAVQVDSLPDVHFITSRSDAVYFYTQDGRGQCYPIEGQKTGICWFRNYLVVASDYNGKLASTTDKSSATRRNTLTVFDVQNRFIAYTAPIKPVRAVTSEWGTLFVLSQEEEEEGRCRLYQLSEKDVQSKLDLLFKKNFYDIAIKVAKSSGGGGQFDTFAIVEIFRQYADHLYAKGDYAGAVDNYVKTVGHLEPSYVIRKFLDTHRIHDLTTYMRALHAKKSGGGGCLANKDHTILLLNCYTKLKDERRLDEFISDDSNVFDVIVAVKVLRQADYNRQAASLAERHRMHETYLEIQLDDLQDHGRALEYVAGLEFRFAEASMRRHGGALLHNLPKETVAFLKLLCTNYRTIDDPPADDDDDDAAAAAADPDQFLHHFFKMPEEAVDFLEHVLQNTSGGGGGSSSQVYNCLLENYLQLYSKVVSGDEDLAAKILTVMKDPDAKYDRDHLLVACQLHGFHRGTLFLYERKGLFGEILKHHVDHGDLDAALSACRKHDLWLQTLQCFADSETARPDQVAEILHQVERQHLTSPLLVVRTLSTSGLQFGLVKEFLKSSVRREDLQAEADLKRVEMYRAETAKVQKRIDELRNDSITFQENKCFLCLNKLDLPTVHFLCRHSFHLQCFQTFPESDSECPQCAKANKHILDIVRSQCDSRDHHDSFHIQLEKADDGFAVVADYFSRGMFRSSSSEKTTQPPPEAARTQAPAAVKEEPSSSKGQTTTNPFGNDWDQSPSPSPRSGGNNNPFGEDDDDDDDDDDEGLNPFS